MHLSRIPCSILTYYHCFVPLVSPSYLIPLPCLPRILFPSHSLSGWLPSFQGFFSLHQRDMPLIPLTSLISTSATAVPLRNSSACGPLALIPFIQETYSACSRRRHQQKSDSLVPSPEIQFAKRLLLAGNNKRERESKPVCVCGSVSG